MRVFSWLGCRSRGRLLAAIDKTGDHSQDEDGR